MCSIEFVSFPISTIISSYCILVEVNVLVASGIAPEKALDYMNVIGRTATAAQAEIVDISKTAFSVTDNLKVNVDDLGKTMDMLAQAGKEGRFELKDMSAAFPSLTAGASMLGMKGIPAVAQLGAALQVAMKGAGSAPEAATNFESFLQSITSPMAVNRFQELYNVDLPQFLNKTLAESKDPIEEMIVLINELTGGDVFAVSQIFRNKTDLNFLKPMMQNLDEYRRIKASAMSADGIMDEDFNHMMETTNEQIKLLKINMKELVFPHLHEPIQKLNTIITKINSNPAMQKGLFGMIVGTIGVGILLTTLGTATILVGKLVKGYGEFLGVARNLTPALAQNAIKLFNFIGLNSTAHNLTYGRKIMAAGNPLGLDMSNFSIKSGLFADIRRIDKNLKNGIIQGFKELPNNISKSTATLKKWSITSIKAIPSNLINSLSVFKKSFLSIPNLIKN
ncbi:MAG: phage tail tape measure protein, partial [Candidatus Gastranaerophilales bacterium]|nr:phage tail tape measure protein [Candidatus Gastranaerophilales bacterium]